MADFYRPELVSDRRWVSLSDNNPGSSRAWYDKGTPGFNGYFKWHQATYGSYPQYSPQGLSAPADWQPPEDWTYSAQTGHWYTPTEMKNAGYDLQNGKWVDPNEARRAEVEKQTAEFDAQTARRRNTESRLRSVKAAGRAATILTGAHGVAGKALLRRETLQNSMGVKK